MKGRSIQNICLVFLLVLGVTVAQAGAAVLTVGSGGNFSSIQEAVNNAQNGDTIRVSPGVYRENINVNKELAIISSGEINRTYIIGAVPTNDVFSISSNNVTISGFHVIGGPSGIETNKEVGLYLEGVNNCSLRNNVLVLNDIGIGLNNSQRNLVDNNLVGIGTSGIILSGSNENMLSNNLLMENSQGILMDKSSNNTLVNNTADSNEMGFFLSASKMNMFASNLISRNEYGATLTDTSESNVLTDNTMYMNGLGLYFNGSSGNTIYLNKFFNFLNAKDEGTNTWNNTSAGNFWNDYNGTDADGNGIGDTPYIINQATGSIDYMPLVANATSGNNQ